MNQVELRAPLETMVKMLRVTGTRILQGVHECARVAGPEGGKAFQYWATKKPRIASRGTSLTMKVMAGKGGCLVSS